MKKNLLYILIITALIAFISVLILLFIRLYTGNPQQIPSYVLSGDTSNQANKLDEINNKFAQYGIKPREAMYYE